MSNFLLTCPVNAYFVTTFILFPPYTEESCSRLILYSRINLPPPTLPRILLRWLLSFHYILNHSLSTGFFPTAYKYPQGLSIICKIIVPPEYCFLLAVTSLFSFI